MAYTPKTWLDGSAGGTLVTAEELNRIEQGIEKSDGLVFHPESYGALANGSNDDGPAINQAAVAAGAVNGILSFKAGASYRSTVGLTQATGLVQWEGNGATVVFTSNTFDLVSLGPVGLSDVNKTNGYVRRLTVLPPGAEDSNYLATANGKAGIVWNSTRHARTEDVSVGAMDIAFDLRGNCYGHKFIRTRTVSNPNVGILLRGGAGLIAGSGSDTLIDSFWGGGYKAAFWLEGNAGGYWFRDCKPGAGQDSAPLQDTGIWTMGLTYNAQTTVVGPVAVNAQTITVADATKLFTNEIVIDGQEIQILSKSGNVLTVATTLTGGWQANYNVKTAIANDAGVQVASGLGSVHVDGGGVEGSTKVHAFRLYQDVSGLVVDGGLSLNANNDGAANDVRALRSVLKHTGAGGLSVTFQRLGVQGKWLDAAPITMTNRWLFSNTVEEYGTWCAPSGGPAFAGVPMYFLDRPMISFSGIPGIATAKGVLHAGNRPVRVTTGGALEVGSADYSTWTALSGASSGGGMLTSMPSREQGAPYQMTVAADAGRLVLYNSNSATGTYTLPLDAPDGTMVAVGCAWTSDLIVSKAANDVAIRRAGGTANTVTLTVENSACQFLKVPGGRWLALPFEGCVLT